LISVISESTIIISHPEGFVNRESQQSLIYKKIICRHLKKDKTPIVGIDKTLFLWYNQIRIEVVNMDEQTLINLIRDMWNKRDFSPIIELVPYEQRFSLFMREIGKNIPDIIYFEICDVIFTPEEAEKLFFQIEGNKKKNLLFNLLSVEDKLKCVDKLELENYSVANFIDSIQDQDLRLHFTMHFLEKGKIWTFAVESYIDRFIGEYKFKFLDRIIPYIPG
jgi:hypothetical protein